MKRIGQVNKMTAMQWSSSIGFKNGTNNFVTNSQSQDFENHPFIKAIKENSPEAGYTSFNFIPVDQSMVSKSIKKLIHHKATGVDKLPAKLIKAGSQALAGPISANI